MYPEAEAARFDFDYFRDQHVPMVRELLAEFGLTDARALKGVGAPGGGAAAQRAISLLSFQSMEAFQAGIAKHGDAIFADRPRFTDIQPSFQVNEPLN
jgi:uncharacterized protein (TIGR02118 family)